MQPYYEDPYVRLLHGDVLAALASLEAGSVQCVVTSPPYWALRDYGTGSWEGGDPACDHKVNRNHDAAARTSTLGGSKRNVGNALASSHDVCGRCGAVRIDQQLGSEAVPDCLGWATGVRCGTCYICHMVAVFEGVKRVLRDDGTCWVNIGDSYAGSGKGMMGDGTHASDSHPEWLQHTNQGARQGKLRVFRPGEGTDGIVRGGRNRNGTGPAPGLKAKDLVLIPARLALALQAAGWFIRSHIVWAKKAPMPESVSDRPSNAWESVWLLTKAAKYYYDADAVREPQVEASFERSKYDRKNDKTNKGLPTGADRNDGGKLFGSGLNALPYTLNPSGRNQRNVWLLGPEPTPEAHFATFPSEIPRRAILAGTSERGCCPVCGAPWAMVTEREFIEQSDYRVQGQHKKGGDKGMDASNGWGDMPRGNTVAHTLGWKQSCACPPSEPIPCTVADVFVGSGTTVAVAKSLGRYSLGIDLSAPYLDIAVKRVQAVPLPMPGMTGETAAVPDPIYYFDTDLPPEEGAGEEPEAGVQLSLYGVPEGGDE